MSYHDVFKNNSVGINVQIRLDQFSGSPGVGLTEYYLAVSVPLLFFVNIMWPIHWLIHLAFPVGDWWV